MSLEQLPDSRRAILMMLKREGPSTIARLADQLELTGEAIRQQLLQLQRDGFIEVHAAAPGRTGRPAGVYVISEAGDHLFPKQYDVLNVAIIDAIVRELGTDAATRVLERVTDERVSATAPMLEGLTLAERVAALRDWYLSDDPFMDADVAEYRLIERNCPFYATAMRRPALCSVSVNALTRLLGVRVVREEKFQNGDGRCVFRALVSEPVTAASWQFTFE